jgi:hypothetical protein
LRHATRLCRVDGLLKSFKPIIKRGGAECFGASAGRFGVAFDEHTPGRLTRGVVVPLVFLLQRGTGEAGTPETPAKDFSSRGVSEIDLDLLSLYFGSQQAVKVGIALVHSPRPNDSVFRCEVPPYGVGAPHYVQRIAANSDG